MATRPNKKQAAPGKAPEAEAGTDVNRKTEQSDYTPLEWFSKHGARFVRVAAWNDKKSKSPGKAAFETNWQNTPLTSKDVLPHVKRGGNIGMLCGKHSGGLCLLDLDDHLQEFLEYFPALKAAPIVTRSDAPNRGKIVLKVIGDIPKNASPKVASFDLLATGKQGVIPPSIHPNGQPYQLHNADQSAFVIDGAQVKHICESWHEFKSDKKTPAEAWQPSNNGKGRPSGQTKDFIEFGAGPHTRNNRLFIAACDLCGCGFNQADAEFMLLPVWKRMSKDEKEFQSTLKQAYKQPRTPSNPHAFEAGKQKNIITTKNAPLSLLGDDFDEGDPRESFQVKRYDVINGAYHSIEFRKDKDQDDLIPVKRALCNFDARILEEIAKDDGQEVTRVLKIKGQLAAGPRLPEIEVDAAEFKMMNWVMQQWGVKPIIYAGQSNGEKLREAMQWLSKDGIKSRTEYTHTGWREVDGKRVYLTTTGAIGLDNVTVSLEGGLKRYAIPTSLEGINLQEAVKKSLALLDLAPRSVTWALWGCMYLAPLADISPIDFMLWLFAESGSLKSTLAALFLCHYGKFTYKTLPEGWASTDNALEKSIFVTKDAPIVIDDFAPQASGMEAQKYENRANRIIRAIGNHSPRSRMNSDRTVHEGYPARGLVISTAEQLPSGQSILARVLPVEVAKDTVNIKLLTEAQRNADYLPQAMTGYLIWLAKKWDSIKAKYQGYITTLRDEMRGDYHLRTPEMFANLLLGIDLGLSFALDTGGITKAQRKEFFSNAKAEIKSLAESQSDHVRDELPTQRFINVLESLISQGEFYLNDAGGNADTTGKIWLGWFDDDYVYIQSDTAYNAVSEFLRREGAAPLLKSKSLYSMLGRYELIMPGADRTTAPAFHKGRTYRVLRFYKNKVNFTAEKSA